MVSRLDLLADWQRKLTAAESISDVGSRGRWLARMQIRLYHFLLSCYGSGDWRGEPPHTPFVATNNRFSPMGSGELLGPPLEGKSAKSSDQIRLAIKQIASAQGNPPPAGPLAKGIAPNNWIIAGTYRNRRFAEAGLLLLRHHALTARTRRQRRETIIEVWASERDEALALLDALPTHLPGFSIPREPAVPRAHRHVTSAARIMQALLIFGPLGGTMGLGFGWTQISRRGIVPMGANDWSTLLAFFVATYCVAAGVALLLGVYYDWLARTTPLSPPEPTAKE